MEPLTVSQLVAHINTALNTLGVVEIVGEVSGFKILSGRPFIVFDLKDEESTVGCFMLQWNYKTPIEDGMLIRAVGRPELKKFGKLSFTVTSLQPSGEGALKRAFELLKKKLDVEGLFAPERKRALPRFPQHIALITSRDAAAYSDFLKVLQARVGGITISFLHTQVQGESAPQQLLAALTHANTELHNLDAIVMVRGGGSLEDLQAFNDEEVVRAVAASRTPTIVGIGHERDVCLAELAADLRASTPSNAAELLVMKREEIAQSINQLREYLILGFERAIQSRRDAITQAVARLRTRAAMGQRAVNEKLRQLSGIHERIVQTIMAYQRRLTELPPHLHTRMRDAQTHVQQTLAQLARFLDSLSPKKTLARGYSITRTAAGQVVKSAAQLSQGDTVRLQFAEGDAEAQVGPAPTQHHFDF